MEGGVDDLSGSEKTKTEHSSHVVPNRFKSYHSSEIQDLSENSYLRNLNGSLSVPRKVFSSVKMKYPNHASNGELLNKFEEVPCQPSHQVAKPLNISSRVFEVQNLSQSKSELLKRTGKLSLAQSSYFYHQPICEGEQLLIDNNSVSDNIIRPSTECGDSQEHTPLAISASIRGN